jgi:polar amino acid transport system substrate-binding protein
MKRKFTSLILSIALVAVGLSAQEIVQFDAANAPFMYAAKDGKAAGLYPALFKEAFNRMGVKVTLNSVPWKRALSDTDAGLAGTGGIYQNADRLKKYDFSDPYYEERLAIYVLAGKEFKFDSIADLTGKTFSVLKGWSYGDEFDNAVKAGSIKSDDGATDDQTNFKKLAIGRCDGVISVVESGTASIQALKLEGKVVALPRLLVTNKVYLAFAKTANKTKLLADFNKTMAAMEKDGSFKSIVNSSFAGQ